MKVAQVRYPRLLVSTLALSLAACGGGGGGGGGAAPPVAVTPAPTPSPTPTPTPTPAACSLRAQQDAVSSLLDEWYLFPNLLASANPDSFSTLQAFVDARVAPARAQNRDRFFTGVTSIAQENALIQSGSSAGFGVRLGFDSASGRLFVVEGYEGTPGFEAGLDRGTEILAIGTASNNLQLVSNLFAQGGSAAVSNALGPNDVGVTRVLQFRPRGGTVTERSVTKANFALDPVSDRYGVRILNDGGTRVGYLNLRTFIIEDAQRQMREAFGQFRAEGITRVVIDLRYNGGGLVSGADVLGDLLLAGRTGQVWSRNVWRPEKESQNRTRNIGSEPNAINPTRIAFITTGASASASELVINSLLPYAGNNIALIGSNTFGKPVGQAAFDFASCDLRARPVTFQTVNASGQGDYFNGLAAVMPNTCRANDDIGFALGDPAEASLRTALDFVGGRSCTPIVSSNGTMWTMRGERDMLQSRRPNAAQIELPGLF
ncbi:MAG: S41 family peptidase [Porphyrobacter sp.]|jgi:C-terminal processing protease CtpA/Prc|nr:S41 family peptidase [Porphyrobacter sp.]